MVYESSLAIQIHIYSILGDVFQSFGNQKCVDSC